MKPIIISLLLLFTVNAQTAWYVNTQDDTGPWLGTAANPWKWFDSDPDDYYEYEGGVQWESLTAGDTIYISGGTDSTVIRPANGEGYIIQNAHITGGEVVITKDNRSGHNGDVYFMNSHLVTVVPPFAGSPVQSNVQITDSYGLKFVNLNFIVNQPQSTVITDPQSTCLTLIRDSAITFENCHIRTNGVAGAVAMDTPANIEFINCIIENDFNVYTNDNDIFTWSQAGYGGVTAKGNLIINRNNYEGFSHSGTGVTTDSLSPTSFSVTISGVSMATNYHRWAAVIMGSKMMIVHSNNATTFYGVGWTELDGETATSMAEDGQACTIASLAHRDVMQMGYGNNPSRPQTKFINNFIWVLHSQNVNSWNQGHYLGANAEDISIQNFVYINNLFVFPIDTNGQGVSTFAQNWDNALSKSKWEFYNNTFIASGGWIGNTQAMDTCISYNNMLVMLNRNSVIRFARSDEVSVDSIDYNFYSIPNWDTREWLETATFLWDNYNYWDWSEWQAAGNDVHSLRDVNGTIDLQSVQDSVITAYYTISGRDAGKNLSYLAGKYPEIMYDILGNERNYNGSWDIGALEFTGGASPIDSLPNAFTLTDITNAELNTEYYAQTGDLTGFDSAYAHIDYGEYNVNGGSWKDASEWTMVYPLNDIYLRYTTGSTYDSTATITLTVGSRTDTWTITTKSAPTTGVKSLITSNGNLSFTSDGKRFLVRSSSYTPPAEPDTIAPSKPTTFVAIGGSSSTQFNTTWTDPSDTDLDSIRYYEGSSNDTTALVWITSITAGAESYLRTGRTANTDYWCAVKAVDDSGNVSYFSNVDSATTLATPESGTPLANLDLAYLTQSFGAHLYDHSLVGSAGSTTMQDEITAYNTANSSDGSLTRITPDYPDCGDMIWDWNQLFFGGTGEGNTSPNQNVITEYAIPSTYSIIQVTIGFNSGDIWFPGWYVDETDTLNYSQSHIENVYKYWIRQMVSAMERYPDKYWILWNIPPVTVGSSSGTADALRHANFNIWMTDTLQAGLDSYGAFPENVYIFDVFTLLKDPSSNFMNPAYADGEEDSHPNAAASSYIAPIYIQRVFDNARAYRIPE